MSGLWELTTGEMLEKLSRREVSAVELTRETLARIEAVDGRVKAFVSVDAEGALAKAAQVDRRRSGGGAGDAGGRAGGGER